MNDNKNLTSLEEMIASLGGAGVQSDGGSGLLMEHLESARRNLLGSRHGEYGLSLEQAKESLACISDKGDRAKMQKTLTGIIDSAKPHAVRRGSGIG